MNAGISAFRNVLRYERAQKIRRLGGRWFLDFRLAEHGFQLSEWSINGDLEIRETNGAAFGRIYEARFAPNMPFKRASCSER